MYVMRGDAKIVASTEVMEMRRQYRERFGERFPSFNYVDFQGTEEKRAGQVYKEALEKALREDKPYHIVSHRYDFFDH